MSIGLKCMIMFLSMAMAVIMFYLSFQLFAYKKKYGKNMTKKKKQEMECMDLYPLFLGGCFLLLVIYLLFTW